MSSWLRISKGIDAVNLRVGKIVAWAILVAVLVSAINAIVRKIFGISSNAWLELQWYLFGAVFMLCSAWTLKVNEHIRIDIVASRLRKVSRDLIDLFGHVFFLFPFVLLMIYLSTPFFLSSYRSGEVSTNAGGLAIWPAKGLILLGFIMLGFQCLSEAIKRIAIMSGDLVDKPVDVGLHGPVEAEAERLIKEFAKANNESETPDGGVR